MLPANTDGPRPRVAIICSASEAIGLGHVSRCLNLGSALKGSGFEVSFFIDADGGFAPGLVESRGFEVAWAGSSIHDAVHVASRGSGSHQWAIVDSYSADSEVLARMADQSQLVVIDDLADRDLGMATLIVNPTPRPLTYHAEAGTVLSGPKYALVHESFRDRRRRALGRRTWPQTIERVGMALGATDSAGIRDWVVSVVRGLWDPLVRVAGVTMSVDQADNLGLLDPWEMGDLMEWSDLFIATPSTLAWELAVLGVPSAFIMTAPNQRHMAAGLTALKDARVASRREEFKEVLKSTTSASAREATSLALSRLCDGRGAERVAARLAR